MANTSKSRPKGLPGLNLPGEAPWGLSPSDFAFLWDDCPRCFYLKVARKQPRPSSPFPSVFGRIDRAMKEFYLGERAEIVAPGMPEGVIGWGDRWVKSAPLLVPGSATTCVIRGRVDVLVDVMTGRPASWTSRRRSKARPYRHLRPPAPCLRHGLGAPLQRPAQQVSSLGLLCFLPDAYEAEAGGPGCLVLSNGSRCPGTTRASWRSWGRSSRSSRRLNRQHRARRARGVRCGMGSE